MAPVEGRNVRSMFLTSCLAVIFGLKINNDLQTNLGYIIMIDYDKL